MNFLTFWQSLVEFYPRKDGDNLVERMKLSVAEIIRPLRKIDILCVKYRCSAVHAFSDFDADCTLILESEFQIVQQNLITRRLPFL